MGRTNGRTEERTGWTQLTLDASAIPGGAGTILTCFPAKKKHRFLAGSMDFLGRSMDFDNIFCTFHFEIYILACPEAWHESLKIEPCRGIKIVLLLFSINIIMKYIYIVVLTIQYTFI